MKVSAGTVRREFLDRGLDARALNLEQAGLLFDPSPECDSIAEVVVALSRLLAEPCLPSNARSQVRVLVARLVPIVRRLAASNTAEGDLQRALCGAADRLTRELRDAELNIPRDAAAVLSAKQIARALRGPLRVLVDGDEDPLEVADAVRQVEDLLDRVPSVQLLSPWVEHELRGRKFRLLRRLVERRSSSSEGDEALATPAAGPTDGTSGHAQTS